MNDSGCIDMGQYFEEKRIYTDTYWVIVQEYEVAIWILVVVIALLVTIILLLLYMLCTLNRRRCEKQQDSRRGRSGGSGDLHHQEKANGMQMQLQTANKSPSEYTEITSLEDIV